MKKISKTDARRIQSYLIKARDIIAKYEEGNNIEDLEMDFDIAQDSLNYLSVIENVINATVLQ